MAATKITSRLQTPADSTGTRKDVHLINTTDEVIVDYTDDSKSRNLGVKLREMRPVISSSQPSSADFKSSILWGKIVDTANNRLTSYTTIKNNLANSRGSGVNTNIETE